MSKQHSRSIFKLCKDENLVSSKDGKPIVGTARFLKPCVQTVSLAATVPNTPLLFEIFSQNHRKGWPEKVNIKGWNAPQKRWEEWVEKMAGKHGSLWNQTGIFDAVVSSVSDLRCNKDLLLGLVEFWCSETNTFVFPWGEATVTLEDVMILGGFSTLGESVRKPLTGELAKMEEKMIRKRSIMSKDRTKSASHWFWINHFMEETQQESTHDYEHVAFLILWLSRYVFPTLPGKIVSTQVFPVAINLSSNKRMALAPAVLASLYKNLTWLKNQAMSFREEMIVSGPLKLLQLWAFEHFPCLAPNTPNTLKPGQPRAARFHKLNTKINLSLVRSVLRLPENFIWRPYVSDLKNWNRPSYCKETKFLAFDYNNNTDDELKSFARCLHACVLLGIDCKEEYLPHRVAMQMGYDQDLPASFPVSSSILWENARFAVFPRALRPCVSLRYFNWWAASMSARKAANLKNVTRNQTLVAARRKAVVHSNEFGVKTLPKTMLEAAKLLTKAEPDDPVSSLPISSPKFVKRHVSLPVQVQRTKCDSQESAAAMCGFKSEDGFPQDSAHKNRVESHALVASDSKVKRQAHEHYSHIDPIPLSERAKHVQVPLLRNTLAACDPKVKRQAYEEEHIDIKGKPLAESDRVMKLICGIPKGRDGFHQASPGQFRTTNYPTSSSSSRVAGGNERKRKFSSTTPIAPRRNAATLRPAFEGIARIPPVNGDRKLKRVVRESDHSHGYGAVGVSENGVRVQQKKRVVGLPEDIGERGKTTLAQGYLNNSRNVASRDATSGSIQNFGVELEERLRRLEEFAGISPKRRTN